VGNPFLLRSLQPPLSAVEQQTVRALRRVGKRIAIGLEGDLWLVIHLMIAGRLHWKPQPDYKLAGRQNLAAFDFPNGTLLLTEAGTKRRASLHVVAGEEGVGSDGPRWHRCFQRQSGRISAGFDASPTTRSSAP
jgi:formamidopyrimidine-DNA glycosylase